MSDPTKPAWTDAFPFGLFGAGQPPLAQGLTSGVDLMKKMIGQMPGGSAIPGFLLPTVDTEELDKRISDLRAAESWLDVNLNLLRATIQGLEVQRNTIAAIKTFGALGATTAVAPTPAPASPPIASGLPPGWPASAPDVAAPTPEPEPVEEPAPPPPKAKPRAKKATAAPTAATPADPLATIAAGNWLGYVQDQFVKVANAALASGGGTAPAKPGPFDPAPKASPRPTPKRKPPKKRRAKAKASPTRA